jgi:hypothetical protein
MDGNINSLNVCYRCSESVTCALFAIPPSPLTRGKNSVLSPPVLLKVLGKLSLQSCIWALDLLYKSEKPLPSPPRNSRGSKISPASGGLRGSISLLQEVYFLTLMQGESPIGEDSGITQLSHANQPELGKRNGEKLYVTSTQEFNRRGGRGVAGSTRSGHSELGG